MTTNDPKQIIREALGQLKDFSYAVDGRPNESLYMRNQADKALTALDNALVIPKGEVRTDLGEAVEKYENDDHTMEWTFYYTAALVHAAMEGEK